MNSKKTLTLVLTGLLALSSCGETEEKKEQPESKPETKVEDTSSQKEEEQVTEEEPKEEKKDEEKTEKKNKTKAFGLNEDWTVDGQWKVKINSVTTTDERNPYHETDPAQVVIVDYTYENIGYEDDVMDGLFLEPNNLVDGNGNIAERYPATSITPPKETPVGATMNNAQIAFGLPEKSDKVVVLFSHYDGNKQKQQANFQVPVQ